MAEGDEPPQELACDYGPQEGPEKCAVKISRKQEQLVAGGEADDAGVPLAE